MATFIVLIEFTKEGMANFRETTTRADMFCEVAEQMGVTVKDHYWTMGSYDGVLILEAPNVEKATSALLSLRSAGNVKTNTLRALTKDEIAHVIERAH